MEKFAFALALVFFSTISFAQNEKKAEKTTTEDIFQPGPSANWVRIKEEIKIRPVDLFSKHKNAFTLSDNDQMRLIEDIDDPATTEMQHLLYQQYHRGIKVYGGRAMVHTVGEEVRTINGRLIKEEAFTRIKSVNPKLSEIDALTIAKRQIGGGKLLPFYRVDNGQVLEANPDNFQPRGELVWLKLKEEEENMELCWKFDLWVDTGNSKCIFISTDTQVILKEIPLTTHCRIGKNHDLHQPLKNASSRPITHEHSSFLSENCELGNGKATWLDDPILITQKKGDRYRLFNDCVATPSIHVRNLMGRNTIGDWEEYWDNDNLWNARHQMSGVQSMAGLYYAQNYFFAKHNRSSWDDKGGAIVLYNNGLVDGSPYNASWNGRYIIVGGGTDLSSPYDDHNTLDIVGHEFTHGVVQASAGLEYVGESGALDESFADIFGELIQMNYQKISAPNSWLHGEDIGANRSFSYPNSHFQPDTYGSDEYWADTKGSYDNGGVHKNSGVQNYAFYLLAVGGQGINKNGDKYSVTGIDRWKAGRIAYRALTVYLRGMQNATFADSREAFIQAAEDLYGSCSEEAIQTAKAWFAVGVGRGSSDYNQKVCGAKTEGLHQGVNSLVAGGSCTMQAKANENNISFAAGNIVTLKAGFSATASGENRFLAYIRPCSFTLIDAQNSQSNATSSADAANNFSAPKQDTPDRQTASFSPSLVVAPNPFQSTTTIYYSVENTTKVSVDLFGVDGKWIKNLVNVSNHEAGKHQANLDASLFPPGVYFCRLTNGSTSQTVRLVIAR